MKLRHSFGFGIVSLGLAAASFGQTAVITTVSDGKLTFTNIVSNLEYRIQWAPSGTNATFNDFYNNVEYIAATGTTAMTIGIPIQFRVATTNALSNGIVRASELPLNIPIGTNAKVDVEWAEGSGGPWSTNWGVVLEQTSTGTVVVVPTPHFYRINFVNCPSNYHSCVDWIDATDPAADRTNTFVTLGFQQYSKPCLKIKVGETVTFSGDFGTYPFRTACQDTHAMNNFDSFGLSHVTYIFYKPGYFGYYAQGWGFPDTGAGTAGNIWVIP